MLPAADLPNAYPYLPDVSRAGRAGGGSAASDGCSVLSSDVSSYLTTELNALFGSAQQRTDLVANRSDLSAKPHSVYPREPLGLAFLLALIVTAPIRYQLRTLPRRRIDESLQELWIRLTDQDSPLPLVTGATGGIGGAIAHRLQARRSCCVRGRP